MLAGQNMIEAARQIEAKCYDSAKDAKDYKRKVEKRLGKAAKALEASQRPSMSKPSDTAPLEKKQALARKRSREDAAPEWWDLLRAARDSDSARDLLREHGATLEWWRSSDVIGRRLRAIIDSATQAGSVGDEARTWASAALQKVEKLEKADADVSAMRKELAEKRHQIESRELHIAELQTELKGAMAHAGEVNELRRTIGELQAVMREAMQASSWQACRQTLYHESLRFTASAAAGGSSSHARGRASTGGGGGTSERRASVRTADGGTRRTSVRMADGGAIDFRAFINGTVHVRLRGACAGCPSSTATLKDGIERLLTSKLDVVQSVVAST